MRYCWLALCSMLIGSAALKAQQAPQVPAAPALDPAHNRLDAMLMQWEEKMKSVTEVSAEVIREKEDYVLRRTTVYEGKAKYKRPNLASLDLRRRDRPAIFEKYVATGAAVYEYNQSSQEIRIHEMPPPKPGQVSDDNLLSFLFEMKAAEIKRRYDLRMVGKPDDPYYIYLEIYPRFPADKADFQRAQLAITKSTMMPRMLIFTEPNSNRVKWDIPMIDIGAKLERNEFTSPALPAGWKFVRMPPPIDARVQQGQNTLPPRVVRPKP